MVKKRPDRAGRAAVSGGFGTHAWVRQGVMQAMAWQ